MSDSVNIMPSFLNPWEVAHNLTKAASRQTSTLLSEFCTVQVLLGLGNLSALRNMGIINAFGNRTWPLFRGVHKVGFHYSM